MVATHDNVCRFFVDVGDGYGERLSEAEMWNTVVYRFNINLEPKVYKIKTLRKSQVLTDVKLFAVYLYSSGQ